jgi:hypothetical protein
MTLNTTSAQEIAAKLTEAQRRAVLFAQWREQNGVWHPAGWHITADRRVRYRLSCAGVLRDYLTPTQRLTPLGLEVRNLLEQERQQARANKETDNAG